MFQKPLKEDLDGLQKQQIIMPLSMDETLNVCNNFVLVCKAYGKAWLNKVLTRLVHRGPTSNDTLPRLAGCKVLHID